MRYPLLLILCMLIRLTARAGVPDSVSQPPVTLAGDVPHYFLQSAMYQNNSYTTDFQEHLYRPGSRRRRAGTALVISGGSLVLLGVGLIAYSTSPDALANRYDVSLPFGCLLGAGGLGLGIPGLHLLLTQHRPRHERLYHQRREVD